MSLFEKIMRVFFRSRSSLVVVVNAQEKLAGVIHKEKLVRHMADLDGLEESSQLEMVPAQLIDFPTEKELAPLVRESGTEIPVINRSGEWVANWEALRVLASLKELPMGRIGEFRPGKVVSQPPVDELRWLKELVLENIVRPLYVTNLEGKTLFYNLPFESTFLGGKKFTSVKKCEAYFLEINRQITTRALEEGGDLNEPRRAAGPVEGLAFTMRPLNDSGRQTRGYLYEFWPESATQPPSVVSISAGRADQAEVLFQLKEGGGDLYQSLFENQPAASMDDLLAAYEKKIIEMTLAFFQNNISHAAEHLKMPRQTLQFRIKKLFGAPLGGTSPVPVPRKKKSRRKKTTAEKKDANPKSIEAGSPRRKKKRVVKKKSSRRKTGK